MTTKKLKPGQCFEGDTGPTVFGPAKQIYPPMTTPTPTPTPWVVALRNQDPPQIESDFTGYIIATMETRETSTEIGDRELADATHIVRCVNERESLIQALEGLLDRANMLDQSATHNGITNCAVIAQARLAIVRAKG